MTDTIWFQVFQIVVLIYSVVLHDLAHGLMARSMGDTTAEREGRLTLNPIPHLDLFGSILLPLMTRAFGGFMFGYAKPVPYNPDALDDPAWGPRFREMAQTCVRESSPFPPFPKELSFDRIAFNLVITFD